MFVVKISIAYDFQIINYEKKIEKSPYDIGPFGFRNFRAVCL
jgi:hypothetical protein